MQHRRVVITGMGAITPIGNTVQEYWNNILAGKIGIDKITYFDASEYNCQIAGEIKNFKWEDHVSDENKMKVKRLDPFVHYALAATKEAVANAKIDLKSISDRAGVCVSSGIGGLITQQENGKAFFEKGHRRISPFYIPALIGNISAGVIAMEHGIMGPNLSTQTACATANHSIGVALMIIQNGMADVMIAGGTESTITEMGLGGFCRMQALSSSYNETPQKASRPFDVKRDGFVMGEGAGILILEEYEHAVKRGANIVCEILSIGMTADAADLVAPREDGLGAQKSMEMALKMAGLKASDINYVNAHGTSTPLGDLAETLAIYNVVGDRTENLYVGSTKSMTGHLLGATSATEAIVAALAIKENKIPANVNLDELDPGIKLKTINTKLVETEVNVAISNSFGFGGHNSTVCLKKVK